MRVIKSLKTIKKFKQNKQAKNFEQNNKTINPKPKQLKIKEMKKATEK
ncbi:hypothetical protein JT258_07730 [Helicobacter pylori]|nr:hypothetical protein [Helicobacter pylori]MCQ2895968.1 hypothetical protein [Helicobacter pylori]